MKKYFLCSLLLFPLFIMAQETGVHFEHGLTWQQVQAKAKAENKPVFIDCFATWCGPCKYMSKVVFADEKASKFFNENFINIKLQLDITDADNEEVKSWYATGKEIAKTYNVNVYPTFLFFNSDGKAIHKVVGAADADQFIEKCKKALNAETQYYTVMSKYQAGERAPELLFNLANACLQANDLDNAPRIADEYFDTQKNLYTKENMQLLQSVTTHSGDRGFNIMLNNPVQVDELLGKAMSASTTRDIIMQEDVVPFFTKQQQINNSVEPDWNLLHTKLEHNYNNRANEITAYSKIIYYKEMGIQDSLLIAVPNYMAKYIDYVQPEIINSIAWTMFQMSDDKPLLQQAADWCRQILNGGDNPMYMDTYANILYRAGQKDEAIAWEQKAVTLAAGKLQGLEENLDKMKKGEKTWQ